ncbi:uncharacterized protein LOC106522288, partial [Austrofundulus limnaeus]|uniref:Uncharacterized protein LOC106522288 n=1 Tax=Austrofundulus limnaeus TaxID=52670 RepID=A0A2I4BSH4_AUSLI
MAEATRFLLRLLLFSLLTTKGYQAITARAGSADNAESKDELHADFEGDSISNDAGEESSWVNGPTEESSLEPNETSSYNLTASELPEAEPLKQDRSVLKHQNLSNRFQQATTDNPAEPRSCLPTDPDQPPCPTQRPLRLLCPPPQQPICPPNNSKTHVLPELSFHLRRLLKLLNYKPEVLEESPPPYAFLPLPEWSPVSPQHHGYPPDEPRHYDYHAQERLRQSAQERLRQSAQVPQQYQPEPRPYGIQFLEPYSQSYHSREFREPHHYLPQEFW